MTPWRDLTDSQIRIIRQRTAHRYRPLGHRIARTIAKRRAARLRADRPLTDVELANEVTLAAVELIGEGWESSAAYARATAEVARRTGATS